MIYKFMTYTFKTIDEKTLQTRFYPAGTGLSDMDGKPIIFTDDKKCQIICDGITYQLSELGYFDATAIAELLIKDYRRTKRNLQNKLKGAPAEWAKEAAQKELDTFIKNANEGKLPV